MTYVMDNCCSIIGFMAFRLYYFIWRFVNSYSFSNYTYYCYSTVAFGQKELIASPYKTVNLATEIKHMKGGIQMKNSKNTIKNTKDKIEGKLKETSGKITGNEQLELKGKLQVAKADIKKKMNLTDNIDEAKEDIAGKVNNMLDKE